MRCGGGKDGGVDGVTDSLDEFGQTEGFLKVAAQTPFEHPIRYGFFATGQQDYPHFWIDASQILENPFTRHFG